MTQRLNLPDLARANYPTQYECRHCRVSVRKLDSRWLDGLGYEECFNGWSLLHWGIEVRPVSPSPLLRRFG